MADRKVIQVFNLIKKNAYNYTKLILKFQCYCYFFNINIKPYLFNFVKFRYLIDT